MQGAGEVGGDVGGAGEAMGFPMIGTQRHGLQESAEDRVWFEGLSEQRQEHKP